TLDHLAGFAQSRPVRVGNAARDQRQLDVYGELLDAVYEFVRRGGQIDRMTTKLLGALGRTVCDLWAAPDQGIWEVSNVPAQHTYSKVMCWVALDRLLRLESEGGLPLATAGFAKTRDRIVRAVEAAGFNERLGSYVQVFEGNDVDASLLNLSRYGY